MVWGPHDPPLQTQNESPPWGDVSLEADAGGQQSLDQSW